MYTSPLWERACSRRRPASRNISGSCTHPLWELACQRRRPYSRPVSCRCTRTHCGSEPAREGGLPAGIYLAVVPTPCGSWLASEGDLSADLFTADVHVPSVGASLLAKAVRHSTAIFTDTLRHREQARDHNDPCCPVAARPPRKDSTYIQFFSSPQRHYPTQ